MKIESERSNGATVLPQIVQNLFTGSKTDLQDLWQNQVKNGQNLLWIVTPNPEQVVQADQNSAFLTLLLSANLLLADGVGLAFAARQLGRQVDRITGLEMVQWWLQTQSQTDSKSRLRTFLVGGYGSVAADLASQLDSSGNWCQGRSGYQNVALPTEDEEVQLQSQIEAFRPQVVLVGFGAPKQEQWVAAHRAWLEKIGVKLVLVCGGAFDVLSPTSKLKPAPRFLQKLGLEWFWRLVQEPKRARRQLRLLKFVNLVLKSR